MDATAVPVLSLSKPEDSVCLTLAKLGFEQAAQNACKRGSRYCGKPVHISQKNNILYQVRISTVNAVGCAGLQNNQCHVIDGFIWIHA
jgi:hypothetical protein